MGGAGVLSAGGRGGRFDGGLSQPFEPFAVPLAGQAARTGDYPWHGRADAFRLGAVLPPGEVPRGQPQGVAAEELVDASPAETGDGGLVFEEFAVEAERALGDLAGGEMFSAGRGPAAEVGEADPGLFGEEPVILGPDAAAGDTGFAQLHPEAVARAGVVVPGFGREDGRVVADEHETQTWPQEVGQRRSLVGHGQATSNFTRGSAMWRASTVRVSVLSFGTSITK